MLEEIAAHQQGRVVTLQFLAKGGVQDVAHFVDAVGSFHVAMNEPNALVLERPDELLGYMRLLLLPKLAG